MSYEYELSQSALNVIVSQNMKWLNYGGEIGKYSVQTVNGLIRK